MRKSSVILFISFALFAFVFASCTKNTATYVSEHEVIREYHDAYFEKEKPQSVSRNFSIYLDYSSGMKVAFKDKMTDEFYALFINSLKISTVDFYELANNKVFQIKNLDKSELYKKIKDSKKFNKINAPLDLAINQIVERNTESVFITDGELWQNEERDDPWAREAFEKWLVKGNTITFYVTDHMDAGKQKHLFYMFFTPKKIAGNKESISYQFQYYLKNSAEAQSFKYTSFVFSNSAYELIQEYASSTSGGVNINAELDEENYINEGKNSGFEFHEYYLNWDGIVNFIRNATDDNGNEIQGGEPLISKLFVETKALEFYTIKELGIRVYDVKNDVAKLIHCRECKENKPVFALDENGQKMLDEDNHPIVAEPGQDDCYDEYGELTADTSFVRSGNLPQIKELYAIDHEAFLNNIKEQGRGEVILKIHKNFKGAQLSAEEENLHRIDIYLKEVEENTSNPNLTKFIWDGKQVRKNRSIYNSILGALNAANPKGKVIYTYYVKTQANDYQP